MIHFVMTRKTIVIKPGLMGQLLISQLIEESLAAVGFRALVQLADLLRYSRVLDQMRSGVRSILMATGNAEPRGGL